MLQAATIKFLKDLKKNNNKLWFDANRKKYEEAKNDFEAFIQVIIDSHGKKDPTIKELRAKGCLFRINRDIRFAKDKSPYKINFGASINRGGKKSVFAGYYFHLEPGESFTGGGIWMPMPAELKKVRQEIDYNLPQFKKILSEKKFKSVYHTLHKEENMQLVKVPHGFEKDNPAGEFLKFKSFIALRKVNDAEINSPALKRLVLSSFEALQPLIVFFNKALEE
jgi:uncharacterized protein (TIGR02453 family)